MVFGETFVVFGINTLVFCANTVGFGANILVFWAITMVFGVNYCGIRGPRQWYLEKAVVFRGKILLY